MARLRRTVKGSVTSVTKSVTSAMLIPLGLGTVGAPDGRTVVPAPRKMMTTEKVIVWRMMYGIKPYGTDARGANE